MERWTIREPVNGRYDCHINSSGPYPASFGRFDYRAVFDSTVESVEVVCPPESNKRTSLIVPSIRKGVERGLKICRDLGELVTSLRIEIPQVDVHPLDLDDLGSCHGSMLLARLVTDHGKPGPPLNPTWIIPTAIAIAEQMRAVSNFTAVSVLADALEEAGCDDTELLDHCRQPGEHRNCWVVDLLLGKG